MMLWLATAMVMAGIWGRGGLILCGVCMLIAYGGC